MKTLTPDTRYYTEIASVRLTQADISWLDEIASDDRTSRSETIRQLIYDAHQQKKQEVAL
jgi:hypothetical protein